ncbi:transglutaminase-like domain-containing protein [Mucilaginibacter sp. HMF5004]|uniref:transglutaminase-like domain-containing protein n=1 Tax=Mucilaginibacter rivuli TaxID=2857527 RepID=UPI001C5D5B5C|nr:transglutaminase-like domain-containing protein [Mucilaginibacter rivuli]MBW4888749.1 transglutaminase-like domain-containing protein [Mucilaginibacter rivuli]
MTKLLTVSIAFIMLANCAVAQTTDSSATITSSKVSYQFVYNPKVNRVEIKQISKTSYISNGYQVTFPINETYNDDVTIDAVECKVDNRTPAGFMPKYSYMSISDVFYSDARVCYFPLSMPKVGSTAVVTFNETITDPRFFTNVFFPEDMLVNTKEITIKIPHWMKVDIKEINFDKSISRDSTYDSKNDMDVLTWTADEIPAAKQEGNAPGPTYSYPHLLILCKSAYVGGNNFTYFGTLNDQYAWYRELVKGVVNDKDIIGAKAKELTAGLTADMDKIKAIYYYVQDNIRYIAFENGVAGFKPEKADEVLRKKYGDCKGMANLTKALLVAAGYDARLCWLGTNHIAYDYSTPSLAVDNHMICGLVYGGKTMYLDATESYIGINEYAERIQGRQVLMEDGDKYVLGRIPLVPMQQNFDTETSKLSIVGNSLSGSVSHVWKGEEKESVLAGLNSIKKDKADDALNKFLSDNNSNYVIKDLVISNTSNPDKDVNVTYNVDHKAAVSQFSKAYYVDIDLKKEFLTSQIKIGKRKNDFWFDYKTTINKETELAIPAGYKATLPANLNITNPDYEFHITYSELPGKLVYKKNIVIKNPRLPKAKFVQWNKDIDLLAKTYKENIILKPVQ